MIKVQKVIRLVRLKERDNDETKYSDYEIITSLNEAIRYVVTRMSEMNSDFLEKTVILDEKEINEEIAAYNAQVEEENRKEFVRFGLTGVDLPDDFLSLVGVARAGNGNSYEYNKLKCGQAGMRIAPDGYYIMRNKLYTRCRAVKLTYRASIEEVTGTDETIDLPATFLDGLAKMTTMIMCNVPNIDVMQEATFKEMYKNVPRRRYSNVRTRPMFIV